MRFLDRWRLARQLQAKADEGCELVPVPGWLASEVHVLVYTRGVERAADKWARRESDVTLHEWMTVMHEKGERRL